MKLYGYSAYELLDMLSSGKCSSAEIVRDVMERAKETQPLYNSYITFNDEGADDAAKADAVSEKRGSKLRLCGIPVAVKDNISTKGIRTTCASRMLESYVPPYDATAVANLRAEGAVIIGKTNMDEFAMGSASDTGYFGAVRNPVNTAYSAGGSSGGSAAAVASGAAVLALGSDTGGSIRQPAALCGVVGFCPSYGAVSRYGLIAFASSLDRIGSIGRNARDVYLLHNIINVADVKDVTSSYKKISFNLKGSLRGLKIGVPGELFSPQISDDVRAAVEAAVMTMESRGAVVKYVSLPSAEDAVKAYYIISSAEASSNLARYDGVRFGYRTDNYSDLSEMYRKSRTEGFGDEVKRRIMLGTFVLSEGFCDSYYKRAAALRTKLCREFDEVFGSCDIIAAPVYPKAGISLGGSISPVECYSADICTVPASLAGLPAISVPCGRNADGLPIGLQLIGKRFGDAEVLDAAYGYELARGDVYDRA
ncbi:MAG: Asp-tRNA(Asn)/Glu-tRNA(Gln) amidotransferase subunit GatA [Ruminococcus sp.]|uniref:Asp-tRNA(Asn)/Glu-tRNA(Gln) amidotransferase subunit GatA n=1 Tax=Ruminococcus sp. TaxID=41978 RepID=UPI0025F70801|nr:Asp-tRNA(Asn)/Glu-tRNA(Gln) amidotransferase subunit GatA [Ruminococcus sp.]MCR5601682.1 Asp-tRNA(Asn)/Glu-tRNA(Gln) amidotransferase subunit GatA [Ruminococcus sp.]